MLQQSETNWTSTIVLPNANLQQVIASLNKTGLRIALVCDSDRKLLGVVTDGDIRRALLIGKNLDAPVLQIMQKKPLVVTGNINKSELLRLMSLNMIHQIPIINSENRLIGLHVLDNILTPKVHENSVFIMAGGFGKRMGNRTDKVPKPMLQIGGKPMLEHIIMRAVAEGFHKFVISIFYLPDTIRDYFGDGSRLNVEISYIHEKEPLGTAGALSLLSPRPELPFIVTNGDVISDIRLTEMLAYHSKNKAKATMAVRQHEWQNPFGVVHTKGLMISSFEEKPIYRSYVNAGIYVLEPEALDFLVPQQKCDMPVLFERMQQDHQSTIVFPMHESWMDVGRPEDLFRANDVIMDKK